MPNFFFNPNMLLVRAQNLSHQSSLLGLARWSVLSALLPEEEGAGGGKSERKSAFAALHLALIESLAEIKVLV